VSIAIR